jgi:hypothetical protein
MKQFYRAALFALAGLLAAGCESDSGDLLEINAAGSVSGLVYIDRNANGTLDSQIDGPAANVSVVLLTPVSQQAVARTTTNNQGVFTFTNIPVGRYGLQVETPSLGDSLRIARVDSATITVAAQDTALTVVSLGYQQVPIAQLGSIASGRRVIVQGVALNAWSAFGDSTLHLADPSGVIRAIRVQQVTAAAGDTVRLLGTVTRVNNVATISDALAFRIAGGPLTRQPVHISTAAAANANGGVLANDLVRISQASIVNTQQLSNGEVLVSVDDGSGILQLILDASGGFGTLQNVVPGAILDATGLLIARENGAGYQLKPRSTADINIGFQLVTVAQARTLPVGRLVQIEGLALNGWITFGDSTVHVRDNTGTIRTTRVAQSTLFAGDSVRMVGRVALRDGQTVLTLVTPTVLLTNRTLPAPQQPTTEVAATADGGVLDAQLVRVRSVEIRDTATVGRTQTYPGDFVMTVNDESGPLRVVILPALGLALTPYVPGARLDVTGLLVPVTGGARWQLRSQADIVVLQPPPPPAGGGGD